MWCYLLPGLLAAAEPEAPDLAPPVQIHAGGQPINVDLGHAAPFVADLKGDGRLTLLIGQFGEGRLRLYPNVGTRNDPKLDKFEWFKVDGKVASVPFG
jgi:hypothetical protein